MIVIFSIAALRARHPDAHVRIPGVATVGASDPTWGTLRPDDARRLQAIAVYMRAWVVVTSGSCGMLDGRPHHEVVGSEIDISSRAWTTDQKAAFWRAARALGYSGLEHDSGYGIHIHIQRGGPSGCKYPSAVEAIASIASAKEKRQ